MASKMVRFTARAVLACALLSLPSLSQPPGQGFDTYQTEILLDLTFAGNPALNLTAIMGGQAVLLRATQEVVSPTKAVIPIDGFILDGSGPGGMFGVDGIVESTPTIVWGPPPKPPVPPLPPIPVPTPDPRACWEICWDLYFDTVRMVIDFLAPRQKGESASIRTTLPLHMCIPTFVQTLPFSTFSPTLSTASPELVFPKVLSCEVSVPIVDEASRPVGTLNGCEVTLYPSIQSYQSRWNLSFTRLDPPGSLGAASMTGPTRIIGGWFFHQGSMSQQVQAVDVSGDGVSLKQSSDAFSYGKMVSNTGNLPASSVFDGFFELTIDGVQVFNRVPVHLQTTPEGVTLFPLRNVLHSASNCPIDLFLASDPDGAPAFQIDSLSFECIATIPWQLPEYGYSALCHAPSGLPLPGIPIALHSGLGVTGSPIATIQTGPDGVAGFDHLPIGDYSARVEPPPGYTLVSAPTQDVPLANIGYSPEYYGSLRDRGFGGGPPALPGRDTLQMTLSFDLEIDGATERLTLNGPMTFQREAPQDIGFGIGAFDAEIVSGQLTTRHPLLGIVQLRESPTRPSRGRYTQTDPGRFYPCEGYFELFLELRWAGQDWVGNATSVRILSPLVEGYPPIEELFQGPPTITELDDGSQPAPPRISKLEGRCVPGWCYGGSFILAPPEHTPTATMTAAPTPSPTATVRPGDTTGDTVLNADDVLIFSRFFRRAPDQATPGCNPVGDEIVDERDLLVLIRAWIIDNQD
ncbi:MAG: prealbumin-like fold domain-containing protein [Candidatus Omnitrophica bacterium]|nr:prealbumin-like fold domain-containing protein [Candidatus Omnitrophota bacterium]